MALEFKAEPTAVTTIQAGYGRLPTVDGDLPIVFLTIATVANQDVVFALSAPQARSVVQEILDLTAE